MDGTPEIFGQYELKRRIARGGMAEVFLALERGLKGVDRRVVVKRILPNMAECDEFVTMFMDEARVAARLTHPNVAHVYNFGLVQGVYFIAMEFVEGLTLSRMMRTRSGQGLPLAVALRVIDDLCAGLHYAHELCDEDGRHLNVVHRDVTPQNVILSKSGLAKLVDFGIAHAETKAHVTGKGQVKGKFAYLSPEQFLGEGADRRTDIFAAGVLLYELIAGRRLFAREYHGETMHALMHTEAPSLAPYGVPPAIDDIVRIATAKNPEGRFPTAEAMSHALEEVIDFEHLALSPRAVSTFVRDEMRVARGQPRRRDSLAPSSLRAITIPPPPISPLPARASRRPSPAASESDRFAIDIDTDSLTDELSGFSSLWKALASRKRWAVLVVTAVVVLGGVVAVAQPFRATAPVGGDPAVVRQAPRGAAAPGAPNHDVPPDPFRPSSPAVAALAPTENEADPSFPRIENGSSLPTENASTATEGEKSPSQMGAGDAGLLRSPEGPTTSPRDSATVLVTLHGLPPRATVRLDGMVVEGPSFEVPLDGHQHSVVVIAFDRVVWHRAIAPTSDRRFDLLQVYNRRKGATPSSDAPASESAGEAQSQRRTPAAPPSRNPRIHPPRKTSDGPAVLVRDPGY